MQILSGQIIYNIGQNLGDLNLLKSKKFWNTLEKERYYDTETGRLIAVGKHDKRLVIIPYEYSGNLITPVTIHATTRQQIRFRLKTGRYIINE